jgi:hypothetical protein
MLVIHQPWESQPQGSCEIDWSNPITQGLAFVVSPGSGPIDIIRGKVWTPGGISISATEKGLGADPASNASVGASLNIPWLTSNGAYTGDLSVFVISNPTASTTREFFLSYTNGANEFYFGGNQTVSLAASSGTFAASTNVTSVQGVSASGYIDSKFRAFSYTRSASAAFGYLYANGVLVASNAVVARAIGTSASVLRVGGYSTANWGISGQIPIALGWDRALSADEHKSLSDNPWQIFQPYNIYIPAFLSSGAYTLNLETGVYSFTGIDATLTKDSKLTLDSGTYALSGSNASLLKGLILEASSGTYSLTGSDASVLYTHLLNASSGSYSITGSDATLTYTPTSGAYTLNLESGAYLLTGSNVTFISSGAEVTLKAGSWIRYRIIT